MEFILGMHHGLPDHTRPRIRDPYGLCQIGLVVLQNRRWHRGAGLEGGHLLRLRGYNAGGLLGGIAE